MYYLFRLTARLFLSISISAILAVPTRSNPYFNPSISFYRSTNTNPFTPPSPTTQAQPQPPYPFKNGTNPAYPTATASGSFISKYPSASLNLYTYTRASSPKSAYPSAFPFVPYAPYRQALTSFPGVTPSSVHATTSVTPTPGIWGQWFSALNVVGTPISHSPTVSASIGPVSSSINSKPNSNIVFLDDPDPEDEEEELERTSAVSNPAVTFDPTFGILDGPPPTPPKPTVDDDVGVEIPGTNWPDQLGNSVHTSSTAGIRSSSLTIIPSIRSTTPSISSSTPPSSIRTSTTIPSIRTTTITPTIRSTTSSIAKVTPITPTLPTMKNPIITTSPPPPRSTTTNKATSPLPILPHPPAPQSLGRVMKVSNPHNPANPERIAPIDLDPPQSTVTRMQDTAPLEVMVTRTVVPLPESTEVPSWTFTLN